MNTTGVTNQMFIDKYGKRMTRCWDSKGMYEVATHLTYIRPPCKDYCYKPKFALKDERRGNRNKPGISEGTND